jgi:hypothetical protein
MNDPSRKLNQSQEELQQAQDRFYATLGRI